MCSSLNTKYTFFIPLSILIRNKRTMAIIKMKSQNFMLLVSVLFIFIFKTCYLKLILINNKPNCMLARIPNPTECLLYSGKPHKNNIFMYILRRIFSSISCCRTIKTYILVNWPHQHNIYYHRLFHGLLPFKFVFMRTHLRNFSNYYRLISM